MNQSQDELDFKNQVRKYVAANKIPQGIDLMLGEAERQQDNESVNSLILTQRRLQEIKKFEIRGMMTLTESFRELAIVVDSLLSILDGMEFKGDESGKEETDSKRISNEKPVILFLASNPGPQAKLQLEKEFVGIFRVLQDSGAFTLVSEWAITARDLQKAIFKHKPSIIHFSSHGTDGKETGKPGIYLQDAEAYPHLVGAEALGNLFRIIRSRVQVELVLLNACSTRPTMEAIRAHIPYVVGMEEKIEDASAIAFSAGFYSSFAEVQDYCLAFEMAKNLIELEGLRGKDIPIISPICEDSLDQN